MRFLGIPTITLLFASASVVATTVDVTYDTRLDDESRPLRELACWKPEVGLLPGYLDEWRFRGNIPARVIAIQRIEGPDSPFCPSCWILEYGETSRPMLAIDHADYGFVLELEGMDSLTGGNAKQLGSVTVNATQVDMINCGIPYSNPGDEL